jgi:hypothetical protein
MRQVKCLTEQAVTPVSEAGEARPSRVYSFRNVFSAASPQSLVAVCPNRLIVIWYGEELTESC